MHLNVFVYVAVSDVGHFSILWVYNKESCYFTVDRAFRLYMRLVSLYTLHTAMSDSLVWTHWPLKLTLSIHIYLNNTLTDGINTCYYCFIVFWLSCFLLNIQQGIVGHCAIFDSVISASHVELMRTVNGYF